MSLLTAAQEACQVIGLARPAALFTSTAREHAELIAVANEICDRITDDDDGWQALVKEATISGDGTTTAWDLPADYNRQIKDANVWSSRIDGPLTHINSLDRWLEIDVRDFEFVTGAWTIYGGQIHIRPAMAATETARFFYVSNTAVTASDASKKARFTADDDTFFLGDRALKLGIIWQWKANKGRPYAEDLVNYEEALASLRAKDRGANIVRIGQPRLQRFGRVAYPQVIS